MLFRLFQKLGCASGGVTNVGAEDFNTALLLDDFPAEHLWKDGAWGKKNFTFSRVQEDQKPRKATFEEQKRFSSFLGRHGCERNVVQVGIKAYVWEQAAAFEEQGVYNSGEKETSKDRPLARATLGAQIFHTGAGVEHEA